MLGSQPGAPMLLSLADLTPLLPGIALWALALALPLTALLTPMERGLAAGALAPAIQQLLLVAAGVALALVVGVGCEVVLSWVLGPGWASSLGLIAVLAASVSLAPLAAAQNGKPIAVTPPGGAPVSRCHTVWQALLASAMGGWLVGLR